MGRTSNIFRTGMERGTVHSGIWPALQRTQRLTPQGTSATVVEQGAETPPFGVESPEISPKVPSHDATPTPTEVQQLIKKVAANVIVTLHTFFEKHSDKLTELGISVVDTPTHPWQSQALPLPKEDSALDHTVSQLRPNACAW